MENKLQIFNNEEFGQIRTIIQDNKIWFVGKDITEALGYQNSSKALLDHVDGEDKLNNETLSSLGQRGGWLINESGLYSLIMSSRLSTAKSFKRWVTSEVLPSIRQHGLYLTDNKAQELITDPTAFLAKAVLVAQEQLAKISAENKVMKPKAEYFDALVERKTLTNFRDTAKELGIKQKKFINWLLENNYVYRDNKNQLKPYTEYKDYFTIKDTKSTKNKWSGAQTLITPQGKSMFRLLLEAER